MKKKEEIEDRKKAEEALENIRKAVETIKETKKIEEYVPNLTGRIDDLLSSAGSSYASAEYMKALELTSELRELIAKADAEATKIIEEQKKRALEEERIGEYRRKAENALEDTRKTVESIKETKKIEEYVPNLTGRIDDLLSSAGSSYASAEYMKALELTSELRELIAKADAEATKIIEEQKKRRKGAEKCFYAVIPLSEEKSFGDIGMDDEEVYIIPYRDIAAVVSDVPTSEYELTEENTRRHDTVLRRVMEEHTVVPVEFGTVINNERILKRLMRKAYGPTKKCLKLVDNMVELGVKAIVRKDSLYVDREHGEMTSAEILESLKKKARQSVSGELFSDRLLLNESFLVDRDEVDAFSEEVARIEESYPMVKVLYSGPWSPYNFVHIKIGKEGIELSRKR